MNTFKVEFADGDYLITGFNGSLQDAQDYYVGHFFNLGHGGDDYVIKATAVTQLREDSAARSAVESGFLFRRLKRRCRNTCARWTLSVSPGWLSTANWRWT